MELINMSKIYIFFNLHTNLIVYIYILDFSSTAGPITSFGFPSLRSESGQPNFDLSDFPSLGNRVTPSSSLSAPRNYGKI